MSQTLSKIRSVSVLAALALAVLLMTHVLLGMAFRFIAP